ncbi:MATE family efflux transporter [Maritalea porphyrae]|uniref:MATE family efflux transporter n=1 Tax=Maritalea porphyrae TaxID=880732 RepID=UPI0022AF1001|nr:MATE family efflux transporter [Maritalea porphyrae]MCZ4272545.1 MATE family efflux transporter [Maritalea porphyrae]
MSDATNVQAGRADWLREAKTTLILAWPLIAAQLAQIGLGTTDVIMMSWLSADHLAAGGLATSIMFLFLIFGIGVATAVSPLMAQAVGREDYRSVRRTVRQGFWVSLMFATILVPFILQIEWIFEVLGQDPKLGALAKGYMQFAAFQFYPFLLFTVLRGFLSAHGDTRIVLYATLIGIVVNAFGNYGLMFGNFGLPRLELAGAGISTIVVHTVTFLFGLGYVLTRQKYRHYALLLRFWRPDWPRFFEIIRVGTPIGFMLTAEVGLFSVAAIMMGWLGTQALAAHLIAIQLASISFMVPLGLSQATTIRVGLQYGRGSNFGVGVAGWTSIAIGTGFMAITCALFVVFPNVFVSLFIDPTQPENLAVFGLAVSYLAVAGLFQLVDGAQAMAAASLRGLSDTKVPMYAAIFGYWLMGLPIGYYLGFHTELRGVGVWLGLAGGLAIVAVILNWRFALRERFGLLKPQAEMQ